MQQLTERDYLRCYQGYRGISLSRFTATLSVIMNDWMDVAGSAGASCDAAAQTASMAGCLNSLSWVCVGGAVERQSGERQRWSVYSEHRRRCADDHFPCADCLQCSGLWLY